MGIQTDYTNEPLENFHITESRTTEEKTYYYLDHKINRKLICVYVVRSGAEIRVISKDCINPELVKAENILDFIQEFMDYLTFDPKKP